MAVSLEEPTHLQLVIHHRGSQLDQAPTLDHEVLDHPARSTTMAPGNQLSSPRYRVYGLGRGSALSPTTIHHRWLAVTGSSLQNRSESWDCRTSYEWRSARHLHSTYPTLEQPWRVVTPFDLAQLYPKRTLELHETLLSMYMRSFSDGFNHLYLLVSWLSEPVNPEAGFPTTATVAKVQIISISAMYAPCHVPCAPAKDPLISRFTNWCYPHRSPAVKPVTARPSLWKLEPLKPKPFSPVHSLQVCGWIPRLSNKSGDVPNNNSEVVA